MTTEDTWPVPGCTGLVNIHLTPTETGTRVAITYSKARGALLNRLMGNLVAPFIVPAQLRKAMQEFRARIEKDLKEGKHTLPKPTAIPAAQIGEAAAASLGTT